MRTREYEVHEWVPDTGGPAEFLGRKALKNVHCKALDASDLHQLRFEFGAPVEADCRRRLASTRGYSAYRGGKLVCCAFVTDGDSVTCTDGSRFRITPACPGVVIHALRSVPGIDAEALGKLLAYQIETERQGEAETVRLVLEPDNADLPLAALGFRPASGLRRRIIGGSRKVDTVVAADGASRLQAVRGPAGADVR